MNGIKQRYFINGSKGIGRFEQGSNTIFTLKAIPYIYRLQWFQTEQFVRGTAVECDAG